MKELLCDKRGTESLEQIYCNASEMVEKLDVIGAERLHNSSEAWNPSAHRGISIASAVILMVRWRWWKRSARSGTCSALYSSLEIGTCNKRWTGRVNIAGRWFHEAWRSGHVRARQCCRGHARREINTARYSSNLLGLQPIHWNSKHTPSQPANMYSDRSHTLSRAPGVGY